MKVSEAKTKICPFIERVEVSGEWHEHKNILCSCGDCMAWKYTKKERERTLEENKRVEQFEREKSKMWDTIGNMDFYSLKDKENYVEKNILKLEDEYKDVLELNLSLEECEKEGYCKRLLI